MSMMLPHEDSLTCECDHCQIVQINHKVHQCWDWLQTLHFQSRCQVFCGTCSVLIAFFAILLAAYLGFSTRKRENEELKRYDRY